MVQLNSVPVFGAKKIPVPFDGNFPPKFSCKWEVLQIISARLPRTLCGLPVRMLCHITYHTFHTDSSQMDPSEQPVAPSYADVQASCSCIRTPVVLSSATLTWLHCIALQCVASCCSAMYYTWLHCTALHNMTWLIKLIVIFLGFHSTKPVFFSWMNTTTQTWSLKLKSNDFQSYPRREIAASGGKRCR